MKLKGITVFEQHAEKIVLGLVTLVFLVVLSLQFLAPSTVEVDPNESRTPGEVYDYLGSKASSTIGRMENPASPPEFGRPELVAELETRLGAGDGIQVASLPAPAPAMPEIEGVIEGPDGPVAVFDPPAPERAMARGQWLTADPYFVAERPVLENYLPPDQPYDMPIVSVQAWVDGAELMNRLQNPPEGERAIPIRWLERGLEVLAVEIERQRRLPDGTWDEPERPEPAPWFPGVLELAGYGGSVEGFDALSDLSPGEVLGLTQAAGRNQDLLALPPAVPAISGPGWVPPDLAEQQQASLEAQRELARLEQEQQDRQARQTTPAQRPSTTRTRGRGTGRGGRGSDPSRDRQPAAPASPGSDLSGRIEQRLAEVDEFAQLRSEYGQPFDLRGGEEFTFWTHDIELEPGATYRYRTRLVINNPLFGEGPRLNAGGNEERLAAAEQAVVRTEWSTWTDPVGVRRRQYLFVSGTQPYGGPTGGEPRATLEMYSMFYGYYRRDVRTLSPGDAVYGEIDPPPSSWVYEPEVLDEEAASSFFQALAEYQALEEEERRDTDAPEPPEGLRLIDRELRIEAERLLLDIAAGIAGSESGSDIVTIFEPGVGLSQRTPEADRRSEDFDRVQASHEAGSVDVPRKPAPIK